MKQTVETLIELNKTYVLRRDPLQWIVARKKGARANGKPRYEDVAFVRLGREPLLETLWRREIWPTRDALEYIQRNVPSREEVIQQEADEIRRLLEDG